MSSLLDAVLHSDAAATPASTVGGPTPRSSGIRSSSARPRGPPSESNGANSDIEAFPDDEVVGARGGARRPNAPRTDIPKVVDVTGETLALRFQEFLEKWVQQQDNHELALTCNQLHRRTLVLSATGIERRDNGQVLRRANTRHEALPALHSLRRLHTPYETRRWNLGTSHCQ